MRIFKWLSIITLPFLIILVAAGILMVSMGSALLTAVIGDEYEAEFNGMFLGPIGKEEIPAEFILIYQEAAERFNLDQWIILPAIHRIETEFSTNKSMESSAGAIGHLQFMDCSWVGWSYPTCVGLGDGDIPEHILTDPDMINQYGGYGVDANGDGKADPWDLEDAIHSAAKYISMNISENGKYDDPLKNAVYAYNHADWYVEDVFGYFNLYSKGYIEKGVGTVSVSMIDDAVFPVPHTTNVTSPYGPRWGDFHYGIDINEAGDADLGKPIVAFKDGKVSYARTGWNGGWGNVVHIQHENGLTTVYAHLHDITVQEEQEILAGQVVGTMGYTGNVVSSRGKGTHLHFEVWVDGSKKDPATFLSPWLGK